MILVVGASGSLGGKIVRGLIDCARTGRQLRGDFQLHARLLCEGKPLDASAIWGELALALEPATTSAGGTQ